MFVSLPPHSLSNKCSAVTTDEWTGWIIIIIIDSYLLFPWIVFSKNVLMMQEAPGTLHRWPWWTHPDTGTFLYAPQCNNKNRPTGSKTRNKGRAAKRFLDRHNGGVSAVMHSSPPHVAFEPIVVLRVTSGPCAGDWAACAWRDKGGGSAGVRRQRSAENLWLFN